MRMRPMGLCLAAATLAAPVAAQVSSPAALQANVADAGFYSVGDVLGEAGTYRKGVDGDESGWQSLDQRRAKWNARIRAKRAGQVRR